MAGGMISLETLEHATFAPLIDQPFTVVVGDQSTGLELAEATLLGPRRAGAGRDPFSLTFRGAPGLRLPQGIYRLEQSILGTMEIFITQIGDGPQGSRFEAIFT